VVLKEIIRVVKKFLNIYWSDVVSACLTLVKIHNAISRMILTNSVLKSKESSFVLSSKLIFFFYFYGIIETDNDPIFTKEAQRCTCVSCTQRWCGGTFQHQQQYKCKSSVDQDQSSICFSTLSLFLNTFVSVLVSVIN
jgi:hypothetical protein